jgi:hypothetical protein
MRKFLLFMGIILLTASPEIRAQRMSDPVGARSAGMGYCSLINHDLMGIFNNQATIASIKGLQAGISMDNHFLMGDLNRIGIGVTSSVWRGSMFAGVVHFGDQLYSEMKAGFGYALKLGNMVDAGLQLDMLRMHIGDGYGSWYTATCEGGFIFRPHQKFSIGIHCFNPIHVKWAGTSENIPVTYKAGIAIRPEKAMVVCAEVLKNNQHKASVSAGIEYQYRDKFFMRAGFRSYPSAICFGAGFKFGSILLDVASGLDTYLGVSPSISITYAAKK